MKNLNQSKKRKDRLFDTEYITVCLIGLMLTMISFLLDKFTISLMNLISLPFLQYIFVTITTMGESYIFAIIALVLGAALLIYKKPILSYILAIIAAFITQFGLKILINRPRPFQVGLTRPIVEASSSSFPSGHTIMFFTLVPIMGEKFPKIKVAFWIIAILVGLSRMYLGVHYLSDVIAGAFLGYLIGWLFIKIEKRYGWKT